MLRARCVASNASTLGSSYVAARFEQKLIVENLRDFNPGYKMSTHRCSLAKIYDDHGPTRELRADYDCEYECSACGVLGVEQRLVNCKCWCTAGVLLVKFRARCQTTWQSSNLVHLPCPFSCIQSGRLAESQTSTRCRSSCLERNKRTTCIASRCLVEQGRKTQDRAALSAPAMAAHVPQARTCGLCERDIH